MDQTPRNEVTEFQPAQSSDRQLRDAFGKFSTGVTLITVPSEDGPIVTAANSFSSVSLDPALVLWSVDRSSRRFSYFDAATFFAIHVLTRQQAAFCADCAKNASALERYPHEKNAHDVPLIDSCLARFECRQVAKHDAGDHVIIIGQVEHVQMRIGEPLAFFGGNYGSFANG